MLHAPCRAIVSRHRRGCRLRIQVQYKGHRLKQGDPEFQALPFENRKKILNGWYRDTVTSDPEYKTLPTEEQTRIHQNFEKDAGLYPCVS